MTRDDLRPSQDPDLRELQELARRGRDELDELDRERADRLWDGVRRDAFASGDASTTPATPTTSRQRAARWLPLAAAAVVALIVGVGLGVSLDRGDGGQDPSMLATVELEALTEGVEGRSATLLQEDDARTITVELDGLPAADGFHEVWLLDPETGALVSLGPVRTDGVYAVPDTVDLVELSVLDVSVEPTDGDPTHSGNSLLRGEVRWTG